MAEDYKIVELNRPVYITKDNKEFLDFGEA